MRIRSVVQPGHGAGKLPRATCASRAGSEPGAAARVNPRVAPKRLTVSIPPSPTRPFPAALTVPSLRWRGRSTVNAPMGNFTGTLEERP